MSTRPPRTSIKVTIIIGLAAACFIAWLVYFGLRDGMPVWGVIGGALVIAFCAALTWRSYLPLADERLADELLSSDNMRRVTARITDVARRGTRESEDRRETKLALTLAVADGASAVDGAQTARIEIAVEDALLADFSSGQTIHLLQDAQRPGRVALDRQRTKTQVQ